MKKECKSVKRSIVLALSVMLVGLLVGCKGEAEVTPEPSSTSEVVSENVSEAVSEEISEPVSEELSEVVSEKVAEETIINLSEYTEENGKKVIDLVTDMNYDEFKIIVWKYGVGATTILSNGDSYQLQDENDFLFLYFPEGVTEFQFNEYSVYVADSGSNKSRAVDVLGVGENLEITLEGIDTSGKEYEITVYITKEW